MEPLVENTWYPSEFGKTNPDESIERPETNQETKPNISILDIPHSRPQVYINEAFNSDESEHNIWNTKSSLSSFDPVSELNQKSERGHPTVLNFTALMNSKPNNSANAPGVKSDKFANTGKSGCDTDDAKENFKCLSPEIIVQPNDLELFLNVSQGSPPIASSDKPQGEHQNTKRLLFTDIGEMSDILDKCILHSHLVKENLKSFKYEFYFKGFKRVKTDIATQDKLLSSPNVKVNGTNDKDVSRSQSDVDTVGQTTLENSKQRHSYGSALLGKSSRLSSTEDTNIPVSDEFQKESLSKERIPSSPNGSVQVTRM